MVLSRFFCKFIFFIFCASFIAFIKGQPAAYLPFDQNAPMTYTVGIANRQSALGNGNPMSVSYARQPKRPAPEFDKMRQAAAYITITIFNTLEIPVSISIINTPEKYASSEKCLIAPGIYGAGINGHEVRKFQIPELYYFETVARGGLGKTPVTPQSVLKHTFPTHVIVKTNNKEEFAKLNITIEDRNKELFLIIGRSDSAITIMQKKSNEIAL